MVNLEGQDSAANDHQVENISGLFLAYFIIITGWVEYRRSVTNQPHRENWGSVRFAVDLFILFLVYFLLRFSNPSANTLYDEIFIWLVPLMLVAYSVWVSIKLEILRRQTKYNYLLSTSIFSIKPMHLSILDAFKSGLSNDQRTHFVKYDSIPNTLLLFSIILSCNSLVYVPILFY